MSGEPRSQDIVDGRGPIKCRIPQRLASVRAKQPITTISSSKPRTPIYDLSKPKHDAPSATTRLGAKNTIRPRSGEFARPKSGNKNKEETFSMRQGHALTRPVIKLNERAPLHPKRLLPHLSKQLEDSLHIKPDRPVTTIRVSTTQRAVDAKPYISNQTFLPDQETIQKRENEINLSPAMSDGTYNEGTESISSQSDKLIKLKIIWQDKIIEFEKMKTDLKEKQKSILEVYATMRKTYEKMSSLGENASLPTVEDLKIMNVTKMSPEQLLQLCAGDDPNKNYQDGKFPIAIDLNKLLDMPCKMVDICEHILEKRKEIIDWFETLKSTEKGISIHSLSKKINKFNAENDMLRSNFEQVKVNFNKDLEEVLNMMRKNVNETMALHVRLEELTYEMSELNSQNADLKKQMHNADQLKSHSNRTRVEELERELKDEKTKRAFLRERLTRSEGQVKIKNERVSQLEAALEQDRSQTRSLERTVQQLHEQNQKLQNDFDNELKTLTESIKEHTMHLEEIAEAREKLQTEKEDLEKRLTELSSYYNESLNNSKQEIQAKVAKLIETEEKHQKEMDKRKWLEENVENLENQLADAQSRHEDALKLFDEKNHELSKALEAQKELQDTKEELDKANIENNKNKDQMKKQRDKLDEVERRFEQSVEVEKSLKDELFIKGEYINELENKQSLLEQQYKENEEKMESYVEQLSSLKTHIKQLQEDFGEFENLNELHDMVNQQRANLIKANRQNDELTEALEKKDEELELFNRNLLDHEQVIYEKQEFIKILSEKEEEQANIIKILRDDLELQSQADNELSQQIVEKNTEIESLVVNMETKKQQISNLEKIILTLEEQTRKASAQKKKDQDQIKILQKKIIEYESYHLEASQNMETPSENLDSLIKILEDELGTADYKLKPKGHRYPVLKTKPVLDDHEKLGCSEDEYSPSSPWHSGPDVFSTKLATANLNRKKNYLHNQREQNVGDSLDRKKAITKMDTQKWVIPEVGTNIKASQKQNHSTKENMTQLRRMTPNCSTKPPVYTRNLQFLNPEHQRDDKQYKMFKWAGHRL